MSLADLAQGLRAAGGILSPQVQTQLMAEDQQAVQEKRQEKLLQLEHALTLQAQQASPQYQAQLEALKNDRLFREAATKANGDIAQIVGAAVQYGKPELAVNLINHREATQQRLQTASDALAARNLQMDQLHEERMQRLTDQAARNAEIARHNIETEENKKRMETLQLQIAQGNQELRRMALQQQGQGKLDQQTTRFANNLQQNKIPSLNSSMTAANDLLRKYEDTDIPGLGTFVGSDKVPNAFRSEEAKNVRSSLQAVSNDLLNLYSGLAVTLPESERRQLEEMRNGTFTQADFKNAWPRIVNRYNTVIGNLTAGAGPEVTKEYQSRPGAMSLSPIPAAFGKKKGASGGWKVEEVK